MPKEAESIEVEGTVKEALRNSSFTAMKCLHIIQEG